MAEKISKHCWATPKCGIRTAERWFAFNKPIDYKFIIVRNPYWRMTSFYCSKIIYQGKVPYDAVLKSNTVPFDQNCVDLSNDVVIPHLYMGNTSISFEEFVKLINKINVARAERHLKLQTKHVRGITFDKVVKCENYLEDIKEVCESLELNYDEIVFKRENKIPRTPISLLPPEIFEAYKQPASWFRKFGIPADYSWFYNEELADIVYNKYKDDFEHFGYEKMSIK